MQVLHLIKVTFVFTSGKELNTRYIWKSKKLDSIFHWVKKEDTARKVDVNRLMIIF